MSRPTPEQFAAVLAKLTDEQATRIYREAESMSAPPIDHRHRYKPHRRYPWFCSQCGYAEHEAIMHLPREQGAAGGP